MKMEYRSSQEETAMDAWRHIIGDNNSLQLELISDHKRIEGFWTTLQKLENYERGKNKVTIARSWYLRITSEPLLTAISLLLDLIAC
jgi:hypothetical protein